MHASQVQKNLIEALVCALEALTSRTPSKNLPPSLKIELEPPKDPKHGDLTSNIAMRLAKSFSLPSIKLASSIKDELKERLKKGSLARVISKVDISPPGFINFRLKSEFLYSVLSEICKEKEAFGKSRIGKGEKVNIEFVSANPTGPLTVAHGRQAAVGDALARILEFSGYKVTREYFINDVGNQIELLGRSIYTHYLALNGLKCEFPENGYRGEYIKKLAGDFNKKFEKKLLKDTQDNIGFISEFGVLAILKTIKEDLEKFGVSFDTWFSQRKLSGSHVKTVLDKLKAKGYIYTKDGATWFNSKAFGDEKDRVVIKSDGAFTYLAPDIAYHLDKYKRKFKKLIDIWGPDHHGYIRRLRGSMEAFGYDKENLSIRIVQLATLLRGGTVLSMSTRKGEFITLREVIDEVGRDVAKFFFLMRKLDSHLDFDLEVAKESSLDNPVYYIQYAHARIASILEFSKKLGAKLASTPFDASRLAQPEEINLLRTLYQFSHAVGVSAKMLEPYKIIEFLNELAKAFHSFYTKHRVVLEDDLALTRARLELVKGIKIVLANGLRLLGISFPERM
ncbi:MAG: arginine--tRNA ligase [Omnitrophica bacterium]|nr:arginine--tRNA ligase [Candidatus Omnitrophota bacterium]